MDDSTNAPAQPVWDSGTGEDVVTLTAPTQTVNWAMLGMAALFAWWVYNTLDTRDAPWNEGDEDEDG